jgi:hypothetical protein
VGCGINYRQGPLAELCARKLSAQNEPLVEGDQAVFEYDGILRAKRRLCATLNHAESRRCGEMGNINPAMRTLLQPPESREFQLLGRTGRRLKCDQ